MLCFSLPSVGFSSPILSHSHSFSFFPFLSLTGGKVPSRGSVAEVRPAPLSRCGSIVSLWKKLRLIINISLTYNARQALEEPAGRGSCHPGVVRDGRPGSGTQWRLFKLFNLFVQLLPHPSRACTQSVPCYVSHFTYLTSIWSKQRVQHTSQLCAWHTCARM